MKKIDYTKLNEFEQNRRIWEWCHSTQKELTQMAMILSARQIVLNEFNDAGVSCSETISKFKESNRLINKSIQELEDLKGHFKLEEWK